MVEAVSGSYVFNQLVCLCVSSIQLGCICVFVCSHQPACVYAEGGDV